MTNTLQQRIVSKLRLGAANAALTLLVLVLGVTQSAQARNFNVLYNFTGGADGGGPWAGLVADSSGNLYGTTKDGGYMSGCRQGGCGVVFKISPSGTETVLHAFTDSPDGSRPYAGVVLDATGNVYGTTWTGGAYGNGTVFKIDPSGNETVLHSFAGGPDSCNPYAGVILDKKGNLYGTTDSQCGAPNQGTVFKIDAKGNETVLHTFVGGATDGAKPGWPNLFMDATGNIYGVTIEGGDLNCAEGAPYGCGVVYKLAPSGTFTLLHSFAGGTTDGCWPLGTLVMDKTGTLYGTTQGCGNSFGTAGTIWTLNNKNQETVLYSFGVNDIWPQVPLSGVILDAQGNIYGTTEEGGILNGGAVYVLPKGKQELLVLESFSGFNGSLPAGTLLQIGKGKTAKLYGTTVFGGNVGQFGTVWELPEAY